jgi:REP element-mobilizing transposase RayT
VTTCTYQRRSFLNNRTAHAALNEFGERGGELGAWLGAYVLMPDHLHAFVTIDDQRLTLSTWMKSLKNTVSKALRVQGIAAPHWQKSFFDHVLRSDESYSEKWTYVRENPVRAALVRHWQEWPFVGEIFDLEFRSDAV